MEKVLFTTKDLYEKIERLMTVVPSKPIIPILNNLLFKFEKNKTTIQASDLQSIMSVDFVMENSFNCEIAIPAKIFSETIKNINEEKITFEIDNKKLLLYIKTNNGEYLINGETPKGFPAFAISNKKAIFKINAKTIKEELGKTISVIGQENLKPVLNGVFFDFKDENQKSLIATDVHRLIQIDLNAIEKEKQHINTNTNEKEELPTQESSSYDEETSSMENVSFVLSKKTSQILIGILPEKENIQLEADDKYFSTKIGDIFFISNIIQGKYPDYKNAFPQNNPNILTVNRNNLISSLKRILSFTNTLSYKIKVELKNNNLIHITGENENFENKAEEDIECTYKGEKLTVLYNVKYIIDMLQNMSSEEVIFYLASPNGSGFSTQATLIKEKDGKAFSGLIMPMIE